MCIGSDIGFVNEYQAKMLNPDLKKGVGKADSLLLKPGFHVIKHDSYVVPGHQDIVNNGFV